MFSKLLSKLGIGNSPELSKNENSVSQPYATSEINYIYNLLFCDDLSLFKPRQDQDLAPWQETLFSKNPDQVAIETIATDSMEESRIRALAFNWLRQNGQTIPNREVLGVIIEVPLEGGLDTLAAYSDGRVRYINQTGKLAVFEGGPPEVQSMAKQLVAISEATVAKIGPWDKPRLPPPSRGHIRMTFLVSDGLYFGQGPYGIMQKDPSAAPIINQATKLLQLAVSVSVD
jgi:hypothetical protein